MESIDAAGAADASRAVADILSAGLQQHRQGQLGYAQSLYEEVLKRDPGNAEAHHYLGVLALQARRFDEAIDGISRAIALKPGTGPYYSNRAVAFNALQRFDEALQDYDIAIAQNAGYVDAHFNRANTLLAMGRAEDAAAGYARSLALNPRHQAAHLQRARALEALGRLEDAVQALGAAIAIAPNQPEALHQRANLLKALGRPQEAVVDYNALLALRPADPVAWSNRGGALRQLREIDAAVESYRRAVALQPDLAVAQHNLAVCLMTRGDWAEGFAAYEWRKRCPDFEPDEAFGGAVFDGRQDLDGRSLYIRPELYLGDLIQFSRYVLSAQARGAKVTLGAPRHMHALLSLIDPKLELVEPAAAPTAPDYQCALMSLPLAFRTTAAAAPAPVPYLRAAADRTAAWRERIGAQGYRIGICWQGSTLPHAAAMQRSFALRDLSPVAAIPGVRLISLQKHDGLDQLGDLAGVETLGPDFDDGADAFLDTAAAIGACDLVITADTAVAHLAGALGAPTWTALPYAPDWRWGLAGDTTPWYPTMRLFRSEARGDWTGVFAEMAHALHVRRV